jgi:hypothetical protein
MITRSLFSIAVSAELAPLMDSDLSQIDSQNGAAIGFIWGNVYAMEKIQQAH